LSLTIFGIFGICLEAVIIRLWRQPFQHLTTVHFWLLIAGMKHYFLVSVTIPEREKHDRWQAWLQFLSNNALHNKLSKGSQKLAENVWLIEKASGVIFFSHLVSEADAYGLNPQVRFLTEDDVEFSQ
jgi:hypothetical protein